MFFTSSELYMQLFITYWSVSMASLQTVLEFSPYCGNQYSHIINFINSVITNTKWIYSILVKFTALHNMLNGTETNSFLSSTSSWTTWSALTWLSSQYLASLLALRSLLEFKLWFAKFVVKIFDLLSSVSPWFPSQYHRVHHHH